MAPKKAAKRGTTPAAVDRSPAAKKAKKGDKAAPEEKAVIDAINLATDLSEDCKNMLLATLPFSLMVCVEEREAVQATMVKNLGTVMENVQAQLQQAAADAATALTETEGSKGSLEQALEDALAKQKEAAADLTAKTEAQKEKVAEEKTAKKTLADKQKEQKTGDDELANAGKDKEAYENLVAKELVLLRDGTWEKKADATAATKLLVKMAGPLKVDESLMKTAPTVLVKKPDERGEFEKLAVTSIEQALTKKVEALTQLLADGDTGKAARATAVEEAQKALEEASAAKDKAQADVKEAKAAQTAANEAADAAKHAVDDFVPSVKRAADKKDAAEAAVTNFASHNMECFAKLRDRSSKVEEEPPVPEPEAPAADAAAAEEAAPAEEAAAAAEPAPAAMEE